MIIPRRKDARRSGYEAGGAYLWGAFRLVTRALFWAAIGSGCWAIPPQIAARGHAPATAADFDGVLEIAFDARKGRLKVSLQEAPFLKVVEEIERLTGAHIALHGSGYDALTLRFDYLPLAEGLKRLFRGTSHAIYESEAGARVWILSPEGVDARADAGSEMPMMTTDGDDNNAAPSGGDPWMEALQASDSADAAVDDIPELQVVREELERREILAATLPRDVLESTMDDWSEVGGSYQDQPAPDPILDEMGWAQEAAPDLQFVREELMLQQADRQPTGLQENLTRMHALGDSYLFPSSLESRFSEETPAATAPPSTARGLVH